MQIRLTLSAEEDLVRGQAFYEAQQNTLGTYYLDSLYADIDSLILYAGIHAKPIGRFHRALSKRFPCAMYCEYKNDVVTVVAVFDCRQNPKTMKDRLI